MNKTNKTKQSTSKAPVSSFCVDCALLGLGPASRVGCMPQGDSVEEN